MINALGDVIGTHAGFYKITAFGFMTGVEPNTDGALEHPPENISYQIVT